MRKFKVNVNGVAYNVEVAEEGVVAVAAPAATGVQPEVIAAITAGVYAVMADDAEMIAAITAAIKHAGGGVPVVRIKRTNNLWAISGRNDLMGASQACF